MGCYIVSCGKHKITLTTPHLGSISLERQYSFYSTVLCKMYEIVLQHSHLYLISKVRLGDI